MTAKISYGTTYPRKDQYWRIRKEPIQDDGSGQMEVIGVTEREGLHSDYATEKRHSVIVLEECIDLQNSKSRDYQNPKSSVKQAMHYRRGISTIHDMIEQKVLRARSLLEAAENGSTQEPNHEGIEDTYKDIINYCSFAVTYLRGEMEGQDIHNRDIFNNQYGTFK